MSDSASMTRRDRLIPWYFVLFFLVVIAVNVVMATLAVRTLSGTVTDHAYEKGLAYNKIIAAADAQAALAWQGDLRVSGTGLTRHIEFTVHDKAQQLLSTESVTLSVRRPTRDGMDFETRFKGASGDVTFPELGQWEVRAFATVAGKPYQLAKRIVVE